MTEIPEHLLKRAQASRERAARENAVAADYGEPKIPAHLLERAKAAREKSVGYVPPSEPKPKRTIPFAHTTPGQYNLMVAQIRRIFWYGEIPDVPEATPSERILFTISNPGTWALFALILIASFLVWAFTAA